MKGTKVPNLPAVSKYYMTLILKVHGGWYEIVDNNSKMH